MSANEAVHGFKDFETLCRGDKGYSDNLAQLFDGSSNNRLPISFKEALNRLKYKVYETFEALSSESSRNVTDFVIGKSFVKQRKNVSFDPMKRTTWRLDDGINSRWRNTYKKEDYDGLVVIGCIQRDLIPDVVCCNESIKMDQQIYTLGLEQGLIHWYMFDQPDSRLRNKSLSTGNLTKDVCKGYVVYVAYKLEPKTDFSPEEHTDFKNLYQGKQGYSENLVLLFDDENNQTISFDQALEKLKIKVNDIFDAFQSPSRHVTDFIIGKTSVSIFDDVEFDPMNTATWQLDQGIKSQWQRIKHDGYDGLVVIGCIVREFIPEDVMRCNKSINMNQHAYTLELEQALIRFYTFAKPDPRLRIISFSTDNLLEEACEVGIVFVAYKLGPRPGFWNENLEYVSDGEFMDFENLCCGEHGYSIKLAQLLDNTISFNEALNRLKIKIKDIFDAIQSLSRRITDFMIGKTFVRQKRNPINQETWCLDGEINSQWQMYKDEGYHGLVVIGCIERELIPKDTMMCHKSININQQMYTLELEQALIAFYILYEPDPRLRINYVRTDNLLEESSETGIIYVAYKLGPNDNDGTNQDLVPGVRDLITLIPVNPFVYPGGIANIPQQRPQMQQNVMTNQQYFGGIPMLYHQQQMAAQQFNQNVMTNQQYFGSIPMLYHQQQMAAQQFNQNVMTNQQYFGSIQMLYHQQQMAAQQFNQMQPQMNNMGIYWNMNMMCHLQPRCYRWDLI